MDYKCILGRRVFSTVGHLSVTGLGEMSEAVSKAGISPAEKAEQERKRS